MKKIKIVHILNSLCVGGIENVVISLANDLDKSKYDVTVLVLSNTNNVIKDRLSGEVRLIEMPFLHHDSGFKNFLVLCANIGKLKKVLRELAPDIINTHIYFYNIIPLLEAIKSTLGRVKHFQTIHTSGLHYQNIKPTIKARIESLYYKRMHSVLICVSREAERNVNRLFRGVNSVVIPNYVDTVKFNPSLKLTKSEDGVIRMIYPSRLVDGKNHLTLLTAINMIKERYSNIELWLLGDGELRDNLADYSTKHNLTDIVKFMGYRDDVAQTIAMCDIGVFPSQYEGFSLALMEMMAEGLPIVCSDIQSFRDISVVTGDMIFFDTLQPEDLALKLEQLLGDLSLRELMSEQSIKIAGLYAKDVTIEKYQNVFSL